MDNAGGQVDGCGPKGYYEGGYKAMGAALEASGRDQVHPRCVFVYLCVDYGRPAAETIG